MRGLLFFAILFCSFTVRGEVVANTDGWYPAESEREAVTKLFEERVEACLAPSTSAVVRMYEVAENGGSATVGANPVTVLLYGRSAANKSGLETPFDYRSGESPALLVPAIAMDESWFCAEIRHVYTHLIRSIGVEGKEDPATELKLFACEEILARERMRDDLNQGTSGRYASALETVWKQNGEFGVVEQIQMLDAVFPPVQSEEERVVRTEQFLFDLKLGGLRRMSEKVSVYISLIQPSDNL